MQDHSYDDHNETPEPSLAEADHGYYSHKTLPDDLLPTLNFHDRYNLFNAKPAGAYVNAADAGPLRKLFSDFWHEGELSILFADTGRGKSVLAVQIARSMALGEPIGPFELEAPPQRVIYFDFELTDTQFAHRYSTPARTDRLVDENLTTPPAQSGGHPSLDKEGIKNAPLPSLPKEGWQSDVFCPTDGVVNRPVSDESPHKSSLFPDNFIRCTPRIDADLPYGFRDHAHFLTYSLAELIKFSDARVVIVDNITWLNTSVENSTTALNLMKKLHALKREHGLSILVLAHTPKRHLGAAITVNDMQGSKMLANFADNIFALGSSGKAPDLRYLKHLKPRNCPLRFDASHIPVFRIAKDKTGFLSFNFTEFSHERLHADWTRDPAHDRKDVIDQVRDLAASGCKQREIARELRIGLATVNRYLKMNKIQRH